MAIFNRQPLDDFEFCIHSPLIIPVRNRGKPNKWTNMENSAERELLYVERNNFACGFLTIKAFVERG